MITRDEVTQFLRRNVDSDSYEKKFTTYEDWNKKNRNECSSTVTKYEIPQDDILKIFFNSTKDKERHEKYLRKETMCALEMKKMNWDETLEFGIFFKCEYLTSGENFFEVKITSFIQLRVNQ